MSQWRQDPLTGRWTVIAAGRGRRPDEFPSAGRQSADPRHCPFCPDREDRTTPEILAVGRPRGAAPDGPGWRMRVFPNMYPAVRPDAAPPAEATPWPARAGRGAHEVVVYTPAHDGGLDTLGADGLAELLGLLRERVRALGRQDGVRYVMPFFNHGPAAGATLAHPHGQIIATPVVPDVVAAKIGRLCAHRRAAGTCLMCDVLEREEEAEVRVVTATAEALAVAPWASRFPYELLVAPRRHGATLEDATDADLAGVARVLDRALAGLARLFPDPPLNLVLHGAPVPGGACPARDAGPSDEDGDFHWHLEVLPRLGRLAGFEAGTGFAINPVAPEVAARRLRGEED